MERVVYIVEQIDEAGRLLGRESAPHARMALLLLDNAVEILMHRTVMDELEFDNMWSRVFQHARASLPPKQADQLIKESGHTPIPAGQRKAMKRRFIPKVDYLVKQQKVAHVVGQVVKALHRYRNDAHHRDKVRRETVRAAAIIYYEVACELLATLLPSSMVVSGTDDWQDFLSRFGLTPSCSMLPGGITAIASRLRSEVGIETDALAGLLSDHLACRLDDLHEQLDFICGDIAGGASHESELKRIQFWQATGRVVADSEADHRFLAYAPKYTTTHFDEWRRKAEQLRGRIGKGNLELLREFCEIEQQLEPLERMVNEVASLIDQAIQLEVDIARGK